MSTQVRRLGRLLIRAPGGQVLLALIGEAQHDRPTAEDVERRYLAPWLVSEDTGAP